jgi:hypothetical protein
MWGGPPVRAGPRVRLFDLRRLPRRLCIHLRHPRTQGDMHKGLRHGTNLRSGAETVVLLMVGRPLLWGGPPVRAGPLVRLFDLRRLPRRLRIPGGIAIRSPRKSSDNPR